MSNAVLLYNKVIQFYMYTHSFSFRFISHIDYHRILGKVPYVIQQVSVGWHSIYHSVNMPIPNPESTPHPFGNHKFVYCESVSILPISSFVSFFKFPRISDII